MITLERVASWCRLHFWPRVSFLRTSRGAKDAGLPIVLDDSGKIDATMIDDSDIDHGALGGLADDDHTGYARLAGRAGGQSQTGGTGAGESLKLRGTSHATPGDVRVLDRLRVGADSAPAAAVDATAPGINTPAVVARGVASQVAPVLEVVNSGGGRLMDVTALGHVRIDNQTITISGQTDITADGTAKTLVQLSIPATAGLMVEARITQSMTQSYHVRGQQWSFAVRRTNAFPTSNINATTPQKNLAHDAGSTNTSFINMGEGTLTAGISGTTFNATSTLTLSYSAPVPTGSSGQTTQTIWYTLEITGQNANGAARI